MCNYAIVQIESFARMYTKLIAVYSSGDIAGNCAVLSSPHIFQLKSALLHIGNIKSSAWLLRPLV